MSAGVIVVGSLVAAQERTSTGNEPGWKPLFDGKTLTNWQPTKFVGEGAVKVENGQIILEAGKDLTGITWTGEKPPDRNYELTLQAMRVEGRDFFAGVTFPVGDSFCSLILGGWGGTVVGLSSINGMDASENETSQSIEFTSGRWYTIRHPGDGREDRSLARRAPDRRCGAQGQPDRHANRDDDVAADRRGVLAHQSGAS